MFLTPLIISRNVEIEQREKALKIVSSEIRIEFSDEQLCVPSVSEDDSRSGKWIAQTTLRLQKQQCHLSNIMSRGSTSQRFRQLGTSVFSRPWRRHKANFELTISCYFDPYEIKIKLKQKKLKFLITKHLTEVKSYNKKIIRNSIIQ
jgi:hypothetical protein